MQLNLSQEVARAFKRLQKQPNLFPPQFPGLSSEGTQFHAATSPQPTNARCGQLSRLSAARRAPPAAATRWARTRRTPAPRPRSPARPAAPPGEAAVAVAAALADGQHGGVGRAAEEQLSHGVAPQSPQAPALAGTGEPLQAAGLRRRLRAHPSAGEGATPAGPRVRRRGSAHLTPAAGARGAPPPAGGGLAPGGAPGKPPSRCGGTAGLGAGRAGPELRCALAAGRGSRPLARAVEALDRASGERP